MTEFEGIKKEMQRYVRLFSAVTGLEFVWLEDQAVNLFLKQPCRRCEMSQACFSDFSDLMWKRSDVALGCLHSCSMGLWHIFLPIAAGREHLGILLSEPLLCGQSPQEMRRMLGERLFFIEESKDKRRMLQALPVLTPVQLSKTARLLALGSPSSFWLSEGYLSKHWLLLEEALENRDVEAVKGLSHNVLAGLLSETGGQFEVVQCLAVRFVFLLYECVDEEAALFIQPDFFDRFFPSFQSAQTLGDLESCLNVAVDLLLDAIFHKTGMKHSTLLQKALYIIHQNYCGQLTLTDVAGRIFLTPSYFSRIFKEEMGYSFNEYIHYLRIEKAKELLRSSELSLEQIPTMVGFQSRSYFGKIFQRLTQTTPAQYRRQQRR